MQSTSASEILRDMDTIREHILNGQVLVEKSDSSSVSYRGAIHYLIKNEGYTLRQHSPYLTPASSAEIGEIVSPLVRSSSGDIVYFPQGRIYLIYRGSS